MKTTAPHSHFGENPENDILPTDEEREERSANCDHKNFVSQARIDRFRREFYKTLAEMKDENGNNIFAPERADEETSYLTDEDIAMYIYNGEKSGKTFAKSMSYYL